MRRVLRLLGLVALCALALQLALVLRVGLMRFVDPQSTTFQRSEILRLARERGEVPWLQQWRDYEHIADTLKRAVIASEDAGFADHGGIDWEAVERAWERNQRAEQLAQARNARLAPGRAARPARIVGGSTITQQLAKNLLLSPERSFLRKGEEFVLTLALEALLDKRRILELYLNHAEWGEGVFGAQAAARHYFRTDADRLSPMQAARLAVMLPAPKRFEKRPGSAYVSGRAATIVARMPAVELPS
ncbi:MAG TPA: monofunctional biosynthetic peptidoglycan transglycosylase [Methylibium sp.]|uniref:monofunctional biosynthetic peptidoglycan transglycosylase n=1 Tax=Methylibium sp. TaxID=2067992 RepID=UPI002DB5BCE0|nr:monofunctional biosynthetic peptidoglycan transglycosylase [Methylibium sp.]HEU4457936.1 monofunctional biosynthetic peptidoglycan transglycosylase [Methylibium sp.]